MRRRPPEQPRRHHLPSTPLHNSTTPSKFKNPRIQRSSSPRFARGRRRRKAAATGSLPERASSRLD
uniref:Uncharacterized protein n=1 Tax=Arundo donax TaxID=35708 RepID=A0A0A9A3Z8_ARUDO